MPTLYRLQDKAYKAIIAVGPGPSSRLPPAGKPAAAGAYVHSRKASKPKLNSKSPRLDSQSGVDDSSHSLSPSGSASVHTHTEHDSADLGSTGDGSSAEDEEDGCDPLAAYGGRARVIMLDSASKANAAALQAAGGNPCDAIVHPVGHAHGSGSREQSRSGSNETSPAGSGSGSGSAMNGATTATSQASGGRPLKSSLWFDANFMNRNGDSHNPLEFSSFVTSPTNGLLPSSFFTPPAADSTTAARMSIGGGGGASGFGQGQNGPLESNDPNNSAKPGFAAPSSHFPQQLSSASAPFQYMREPINPSSIGPTATSIPHQQGSYPDPSVYSLDQPPSRFGSGIGTGANGKNDPTLTDSYSWMDGFGMGAPMSQFPVVGPQTVPMLFGGIGSGNNHSTSNGVSHGNRDGHPGVTNGGEARMMNLEKDVLSPGMLGADRVANSLPTSMFGFGGSAATNGGVGGGGGGSGAHQLHQRSQSQSQPNPLASAFFNNGFTLPPQHHQQGGQPQNQPEEQQTFQAQNGNADNSWFLNNFSSFANTAGEGFTNAFDMNMNVDVLDASGQSARNVRIAEPALHDVSWQEYMRQMFLNGGEDDGDADSMMMF